MLRVEDERRIDVRELRRLVRLEDVTLEGTREQVVVDAEEHVALRVPRGQQSAGDDLAGVARLEDAQREAALVLECLLHLVRDRERVVRDEHHLGGRLVATPAAGERERDAGEGAEPDQPTSPGTIASSTPRSTETRAVPVAKTFETPRLDPAASVSPRSG